jgi:glycosyltransferase involved in cell wall biosynthesis
MKISIPIPTYECHGVGWLYLTDLLNSISRQDYKNYEVVVSDQSTDDKIKKLVKYYSNHMDIKYLSGKKFERKISPNINNAIKHCTGDIIKYMCGDDFFVADNCLSILVQQFSSTSAKWLVMGTVHCHSIHVMHTRMIPYYHDKIHLGGNTISSPSVLATTVKEYLDENLSMLVDCELYKRLYVKYGSPLVVQEPLVCNRIHDKQQQHSLHHVVEKEKAYCISLYGE